MQIELAVIGGTGLYRLAALDDEQSSDGDTIYGRPSAPVRIGTLSGRRIAFLARHGEGHSVPPHLINYRANLRRLADLGVKAKEIRVTGGGAKSPVWRQLMADVFGTPVVGMVEDEGAALGGALQAAWALARRDSRKAKITDFTTGIVALNESTRCLPQKANVARYRELQALQDKLSTTLREVFPQQRKLANA